MPQLRTADTYANNYARDETIWPRKRKLYIQSQLSRNDWSVCGVQLTALCCSFDIQQIWLRILDKILLVNCLKVTRTAHVYLYTSYRYSFAVNRREFYVCCVLCVRTISEIYEYLDVCYHDASLLKLDMFISLNKWKLWYHGGVER